MIGPALRLVLLCVAPLLLVVAPKARDGTSPPAPPAAGAPAPGQEGIVENAMNVHYLEIVTPDVDATCAALATAHGVTFGDPVPELGNARTAKLATGGRVGVRAPMRETELPVVRPYMLVDDIQAAVEAAKAAGAEIALPPTEIPDHGTFAIYLLGGIQHGLWQL